MAPCLPVVLDGLVVIAIFRPGLNDIRLRILWEVVDPTGLEPVDVGYVVLIRSLRLTTLIG